MPPHFWRRIEVYNQKSSKAAQKDLPAKSTDFLLLKATAAVTSSKNNMAGWEDILDTAQNSLSCSPNLSGSRGGVSRFFQAAVQAGINRAETFNQVIENYRPQNNPLENSCRCFGFPERKLDFRL